MDKKILGLDLGISSLGWAISAFDEENNKWYIEDFGVRLWNPSEKKYVSNAAKRREYRLQRRLIRKKKQKKKRNWVKESIVRRKKRN